MAVSPPPQPAMLIAGGNPTINPPLANTSFPQVMSKRDKRRNALGERLSEITASFNQNHDAIYRTQMRALQLDINYINNANLYDNRPLDDFGDDIVGQSTANMTNTLNGLRSSQLSARTTDFEVPPGTGRWAAEFVHAVNDAFEEKDVQLTLIAERHNRKILELREDFNYYVQVAQKEHERLAEQVRERVIHSLAARKTTLAKEKDRLDVGDTNALLLHSNQFSLGNPASPGGPLSNRKTRHTRHRLDIDDLGNVGESNKRKRKGPVDAESSPGPVGRLAVPETLMHWKEGQNKPEANHIAAPLLSVDDLFSERELTLHLQAAHKNAIDEISAKRRKLNEENHISDAVSKIGNSDVELVVGPTDTANSHVIEAEAEDVFMAAPEMDRTANSSFYATRSTRTTGLNMPLQSFEIPSDLAGRASAIPLLGTYSKERKKEDDPQRVPSLTDVEKDADLAMFAAAIREEEASPGSMNRKAKQELCPPAIDYVSANLPKLNVPTGPNQDRGEMG